MILLELLLAALIGISLGLLGGGGSILAVPIFVYVLGFEAKTAVAMSLVVVGVASLFAALSHWRAGRVNWKMAGIFGIIAMGGAYLGAKLSVLFSSEAQLIVLAIVMLLAAAFMYQDSGRANVQTLGDGKLSLPLLLAQGTAVGTLTGIVGVGGGFLIVPALVLLAGVPIAEAVGTSLVVIGLNSISGFVGHLGQADIPWVFVGGFTAVVVGGSFAGSRMVRFVPQSLLAKAFALFLIIVGAIMLVANGAKLI